MQQQNLKDKLEQEIYKDLFGNKKKISLEEAFERALGFKEEKKEEPPHDKWI